MTSSGGSLFGNRGMQPLNLNRPASLNNSIGYGMGNFGQPNLNAYASPFYASPVPRGPMPNMAMTQYTPGVTPTGMFIFPPRPVAPPAPMVASPSYAPNFNDPNSPVYGGGSSTGPGVGGVGPDTGASDSGVGPSAAGGAPAAAAAGDAAPGEGDATSN